MGGEICRLVILGFGEIRGRVSFFFFSFFLCGGKYLCLERGIRGVW